MTKTQTLLGLVVIIFFTLFAAATHADTRSSLRGGVSHPTFPPASTAPSAPSNNSGISNNTSIEVDSGGNTGGKVTTGNQSGELHVINEGPTNSNNVVSNIGNNTPPPAPEPTCEPSRTTRCDQDVRNR